MIRPNVHFLKNLSEGSSPSLASTGNLSSLSGIILMLVELVNLLHHNKVQHPKHNLNILNIQIQKLKSVAMIRTFTSDKFSIHSKSFFADGVKQ